MIAISSQLDRLLGRVTMYVLVIICLTVIAAAALVFMVLGVIQYSPLGYLANAGLLLVFSYLANGIAGLVFHTRPQLSSTVITALLLLFIFQPSLNTLQLLGAALGAIVAAFSKYLLAVRGRHIFNPAALGAFVVVLTSLNFSFWWVGTPALLPFVAIGGALVLFRTRRFPLAAVFLVVAAGGTTIHYLVDGLDLGQALQFAVLSSPIVFFACFMLDEPLTLPPRRWQQLLEAALVGVIFVVPFSLGPLSSTPELALVVGNLLAFFFGQRRGIRLEFLGRRELTPTSWQFDFRPKSPVSFLPGQYMELSLPHANTDRRGWRRVFSIASAPGGDIRFGMRVPENASSFKSALLKLQPGTTVSATSISGDFLLPKADSAAAAKPLLLVAAGIGITPFVSQLESLTLSGIASGPDGAPARDIVLLYSIATPDDIAFADVLRTAGCRVVVLCPTEPAELPAEWTWVGDPQLTAEVITRAVPDGASRLTYLSGPPELVAGLERALHADGVRRIVTDVFVGY